MGGVGLLSITMLVGVIVLLTGGHQPEIPDTTTGVQSETTGTVQTDPVETTADDVTTAPDSTEETTGEADETTAPSGESTETTTAPKDEQQTGDTPGIGFGDTPPTGPISPSTPTDPSTPTPPPTTEPEPTPTETMEPGKPVEDYTYEEYMALSPSEKNAFFYKFPSLAAFNQWYNAAKDAYDDEKLVIGDGNINLDDLMNP